MNISKDHHEAEDLEKKERQAQKRIMLLVVVVIARAVEIRPNEAFARTRPGPNAYTRGCKP